jgi:hypothetical protein
MNIHSLTIPLDTATDQVARLQNLQQVFAEICNVLAPVVRDTKCWNRVALHHMMYRPLREQFPQVGSQMVCNAIYSVSRTSRVVYQAPQSPFNIQRLADKPLPLLRFLPSSPVYFDRHTLSIKKGALSMYTLDGRMRFDLNLSEDDLMRFKLWKLHEVTLISTNERFTLNFSFVDSVSKTSNEALEREVSEALGSILPEYILIDEDSQHSNKTFSAVVSPSSLLSQLNASVVAEPLQTTTIARPSQDAALHLELELMPNGFAKSVHAMPHGLTLSTKSSQVKLNIKTFSSPPSSKQASSNSSDTGEQPAPNSTGVNS